LKSKEEIELILFEEIWIYIEKIESNALISETYNHILGDVSFILSGLLNEILKTKEGWDKSKWIDDSLIEELVLKKNKLIFSGVMIWGIHDSTEQWVDHFKFETDLGQKSPEFINYTFLYEDLDSRPLLYEDYKTTRSDKNLENINWRFILNRKYTQDAI